MNISVILGRSSYSDDASYRKMKAALEDAGHNVTVIPEGNGCLSADLMLSVGGDGTFLGAAGMAAPAGIPVAGVNLGHLGFLSENLPGDIVEALNSGNFHIQERAMLKAVVGGKDFLALNEVCVSRVDGSMLGIKVSVDGKALPTYWADGLLVSTPSGSTAYSLSVGGPIVMPSSKVLVIAPVAPHNLNVRPMIVPLESSISLGFVSRGDSVRFSADNRSEIIPASATVDVGVAQFSLKRLCLDKSNFINALSEKLFWGEDKRNGNE